MGLELGNEINWTFNGDIAVHKSGPGRVYRTINAMPQGKTFLKGLDNYIALLRIVHEMRQESKTNRSMKLLSAGLANVRPEFASSSRADFVDAGMTYRLLKRRGLAELVDAAAMHYYPPPLISAGKRSKLFNGILDACAQSDTKSGCWMTEWGINNIQPSCSENDISRIKLVKETRRAFAKAASEGRLAADFYFEWKGTTARSVWRCNGLMAAGKAALELDN